MPYVVSLAGFMPPPRYDGVAWTQARIEEAAAPGGPWTVIDVQGLAAPLDPDPSQPQARNFTTSHGTLTLGWYRVTFLDPVGSQSDASSPVRSSQDDLLPPSPDAVRNQSPLLRKKFPVPITDPFRIGDLRNTVYAATALVGSLTFRLIDPSMGCQAPPDYLCEAVPDGLVPVAFEAVRLMAERLEITSEADFAEQLATGRLLRGFSAGPYSEQYFAPGEFARRGAQQGRPPMDVDDQLDRALWALATEDARDYFVFRATGQAPPVGAAVGFDYRREGLGYPSGILPGALPGRGGPDGY